MTGCLVRPARCRVAVTGPSVGRCVTCRGRPGAAFDRRELGVAGCSCRCRGSGRSPSLARRRRRQDLSRPAQPVPRAQVRPAPARRPAGRPRLSAQGTRLRHRRPRRRPPPSHRGGMRHQPHHRDPSPAAQAPRLPAHPPNPPRTRDPRPDDRGSLQLGHRQRTRHQRTNRRGSLRPAVPQARPGAISRREPPRPRRAHPAPQLTRSRTSNPPGRAVVQDARQAGNARLPLCRMHTAWRAPPLASITRRGGEVVPEAGDEDFAEADRPADQLGLGTQLQGLGVGLTVP